MADTALRAFKHAAIFWADEPGKKKRLRIPQEVWAATRWPIPVELLVEFGEPGVAIVRDGKLWKDSIEPQIKALEQAGDDNDQLFLMLDRYQLTNVGKDYRFTPTFEFRTHLGLVPERSCFVYVEATREFLRVMSVEYRNNRLRRALSDEFLERS